MYTLFALMNGILFGAGLAIANMTNPNKVLNFLDIFGFWDPTLLVVMITALLVTGIGYKLVFKSKQPQYCEQFHIPEKTSIDARLIAGSTLFGIGWGIAGYCPGPGVAALATFNTDPVYFISGLLLGSGAWFLLFRK